MSTSLRIRTKRRRQTFPFTYGYYDIYDLGGHLWNRTARVAPDYSWDSFSFMESTCCDETHRKIGGRFVEGGPVDITLTEHMPTPIKVSLLKRTSTGLPDQGYNGWLYPIFGTVGHKLPLPGTSAPLKTLIDPGALGPKAWNMYKPAKPSVDLGVFLAELRDFPKLFKVGVKHYRDIGKNYLNAEFGWRPFISDIRKSIQTYNRLESSLRHLSNHNGKWIRVSGPLPGERTVLETWDVKTSNWPFLPGLSSLVPFTKLHSVSGSQYVESEYRFTGRFRYYIPDIDRVLASSPMNYVTRRVYGLRVSPIMLWNLIPWSWLVDWFSSVGDSLSNLSDGDIDLVAKYAYMSGTYTHVAEQHCTGTLWDDSTVSSSLQRQNVVKRRVAASPFGFGLSDGDLSVRQWAILAALGIK